MKNSALKKKTTVCTHALLVACITVFFSTPSSALKNKDSLFDLPFEEVMNLTVTSPTKTPKPFKESAAAIYVLTNEDIRRSGATSIAEALRMVPGMQVARINSSKWAISARGFEDLVANKLLMLIDGRSIYGKVTWRY